MDSHSFLKQCISEVIVEPINERKLRCSVCGGHAKGKQWWNQDKGYGICSQCASKMKADGKEDINQSYGKEGTHYFLKEISVNEEAQPEPYNDDETDTFSPGPRDRVEPSKKSKEDSTKSDYSKSKKKKAMEKFVKECLSEVIIEPLKPKATNLVKECILEVLKDRLTEGGYDPQSQAGPNSPCENPYPGWNSKMAKMEEDTSDADFSEPQTWKCKGQRVQVTFFKNGKNETQFGVIKEPQINQAIIKPDMGYNTIVVPWKYIKPLINAQFGVNESDPHGRYAQDAGAGQFDPRTFGVNEESSQSKEIQWTCPHCKKPTQVQIEIASPSDYIACSDCVNCGKEIKDPKLDQEVYKMVIGHFAGNKEIKVNEAGGTWGEIEKDNKSDKPLPNKTTYPSRWN